MRVLITGATGLIGTRITELCHEKGLRVNFLTTRKKKLKHQENYKGFLWNPAEGTIDPACLENVGAIINLAGETIFQPWTRRAKRNILQSRLDSLALLHKTLSEQDHQVGQLISASGISIYPSSLQKMHYEDSTETADDFMGQVAREWEAAADRFQELGMRVAKIRTGLVLSEKGGALPQMKRPVQYHLGASLGSGKQWQSWIHIQDHARLFLHSMEKGLQGVYNSVAPNPVSNKELIEKLARTLNKKIWLPNVPAFVLKLFLGELSTVVLGSQLVSSKKIQETGFNFYYIRLIWALEDLLHKKTG